MKVLFAPIHYFYGKNFGSEMICAHDIFTRVSRLLPGSKAISLTKLDEEKSATGLIFKYSIPKPFFPSITDMLSLVYFYSHNGMRFLKSGIFSVVHHVFPFRIGRTFNPLFIFSSSNLIKIIGPVMVSVNYDNKDLKKGSLFEFKGNQITTFVMILLDPIYSLLCKLTLSKADHIIALNQVAKRELVLFGVPSFKIKIIPIGIDIKKFSFTPFNKKDQKTIHLLTLGYLTKRKGTELIIQALEKIVKSCPAIHLTIIGDGPQRPELEELTTKLDLTSYITFAGFVNYAQLAKHYQRSHILVSMSRAESWGQVYIDAMACGLPIISSKNDGSNGIVQNQKFGYLVDQEDYQQLAKKVLFLVRHSDVMVKFGKAARLEVERKYDWDKIIIPKYLSLYRS